jgi:hypothetical protein
LPSGKELKDSAITDMRSFRQEEVSKGELFLKDLHKQLAGNHPPVARARIELIPHKHTPKKSKK